jgi:hypothetical protein
MLAMDAFCGHLSDRIRNRLRTKNTELVIITSGMASQLKPLNASINKPFKHLVCKHYDAWLNNNNLRGRSILYGFQLLGVGGYPLR